MWYTNAQGGIMKKILLFSMLFILLLSTGCSSDETNKLGDINPIENNEVENGKRLVCSQKVKTVDVDMIADFENDELTYLGLKYEMDLSAYSDVQINAIKAQDIRDTISL